MLIKIRQQGFTLLECMVALFVLSVGLLGVMKLEAVALASTNIAAKRSIAALQASSLAASMHINRGYWTSPDPAGATITVQPGVGATGVAVTAGAPLLAGIAGTAQNCKVVGTPCAPLNMAAYDLQTWGASGANGFALQSIGASPNVTATINCGTAPPTSCMINIVWNENSVSMNAQETGALATPSYTLYVEP
jgi:type IV pilus assembly protein PilV